MRQIKPPGGIPNELSSAFRHVYDEIQRLAQSINNPADNEKMDRTGGKSGDIRLVKDRANNTYAIDGRFDEGWIRFNVGEGIALNEQRVPLPPTASGGGGTLQTIQSMFPPITYLSANVPVGNVTSLPIEPIGSDGLLSANDIITVASINGYVTSFTVTADVLAAATTISVSPKQIGQVLTSGSGVYLTQKSLTTWISQLEYAISIGAAVDPRDIITRVNSPTPTLDKGTTVSPVGGFNVAVAGSIVTITRVNGNFVTDGIAIGGEIEVGGSILVAASVGATTMTATGTVTAGSYASLIVGRTTVPVDALPIQLRGDLGWKVIITDLEDGTEYLCELTATANAGATSISIKGKILPVKDNSPLRLDQLSLISYINILADAIDLRSLFLAGTIYLGDLSTAYNGTVTSLSLKTPFLRVPIKASDIIFIVDNTNPELVSTHTVTTDTAALSTSIPINSSTVSKPIDSKVFLTSNSSSAFLRITGDSITSAVQRFNANNAVCQLSAGVNGTVTSLPITGLTVNLYNGDQFFVYNATTLQPTAIQLTADVSSGASSLPVQSVTINVPSGSGVHLRSSYARSQIKQTADSVTTSVEKYSVAGSLGTVSADYSGSVSTLTLNAPGIPYDLKTGDRLYVVDKLTGNSYIVQLTSDHSATATSLNVTLISSPGSFVVKAGSGVHVDTSLMRSTLTQTASSLTSVITTSSTGNALVTLTSAPNGTVITLATTALPIALVSGQKLYVVNNSNGIAYPVTVSANANVGATSISIQLATVIAPIGSGVNLNTGDYGSKLVQTIDGFALTATSLYGNIFLGTTEVGYTNEVRTSIHIGQLYYPIKNGNSLIIVDANNPRTTKTVVSTQDKAAAAGLNTINIQSTTITAGNGSAVYLERTGSSSSIKVLNDQISLAVTQEKFRDYLNGQFISEVQSAVGSTVTLKTATTYKIFAGDRIRFSHNPGTGQTLITNPTVIRTVTQTVNPKNGYAIGTTQITFDSITGVSANMTASMEVAGSYSTGSSLNVLLNSIEVDTAILKSTNYVAGSTGWAIKGDGSAEFSNVSLRGDLYLQIPSSKLINNRSAVYWAINSSNVTTSNTIGMYYTKFPLSVGINGYVGGFWDEGSNYGGVIMNYFGSNHRFHRTTNTDPDSLTPLLEIVDPAYTGVNSSILLSQAQHIPRMFMGTGIPSTITNSKKGDLYLRIDYSIPVYQLYVKQNDGGGTSVWTLIGP